MPTLYSLIKLKETLAFGNGMDCCVYTKNTNIFFCMFAVGM